MIALDVLYVALATIFVMVLLQVITFVSTRIMYPPEPKIIYRNVPVPVQSPPPTTTNDLPSFLTQEPQQPLFPKNEQVLTQSSQEVQLPEYDPRKADTTSARVDTKLPPGLQAVNPRELDR